jgi:hypothetical protein
MNRWMAVPLPVEGHCSVRRTYLLVGVGSEPRVALLHQDVQHEVPVGDQLLVLKR